MSKTRAALNFQRHFRRDRRRIIIIKYNNIVQHVNIMLRLQLLAVTTNVTSTLPKSVRATVWRTVQHRRSHLPRPRYNIMLAVQSQIDRAPLGSPPTV